MVKQELLDKGSVSRNWCLQKRITRLSGRILDLKNLGWSIEGRNVKENGGTNYYYFLVSKPKVRSIRVIDGVARECYE